jgi:MYXO-CTERM domain-containing protein
VGWSCFDFSNYNGGVRPTWSPNAPDKSCLPDGIVLATQGHASDGGQFTATSGVTRGGTVGTVEIGAATGIDVKNGTGTGAGTSTGVVSGQPGSTTPPAVSPVAPPQGGPTASEGGGTSATVHSSGCAYGGSDAGQSSLWLALATIGLVARLARRRNRAR